MPRVKLQNGSAAGCPPGCSLVSYLPVLSRYILSTRPTTSSIVSAEESRDTASSAGLSGATARAASRLSRSSRALERAARLACFPLSFNCLCLRWARVATLAVRNTFRTASGNTTVPMSRPSATRPGGRRNPLWRSSSAARTAGSPAISDARAPTTSSRNLSVTSCPERIILSFWKTTSSVFALSSGALPPARATRR